jgi:hypothetical protein
MNRKGLIRLGFLDKTKTNGLGRKKEREKELMSEDDKKWIEIDR